MSKSIAEIVFGPILIGLFLNITLWGICLTQMYMYHKTSWRDNVWVRTFIYLLFLAETLQTLFVIAFSYDVLVLHFGNIPYLLRANWVGATDPALTGIIAGSVQIFLVRRLRVLTRSWVIVTVVCLCAVSTALMGIATAAAIHFVPEYTEFRRFKVVVIIWLVSGVTADSLITITLVVYLNKWRKTVTSVARTSSYIDNIVRLTIQTGLLTSAWAIADLILFLALPDTALHVVFNYSLSKLYSNSLLSSLNARDVWKFGGNTQPDIQSVSELKFPTKNTLQAGTLPTHGHHSTDIFLHIDHDKTQNSADLSQTSTREESSYQKDKAKAGL